MDIHVKNRNQDFFLMNSFPFQKSTNFPRNNTKLGTVFGGWWLGRIFIDFMDQFCLKFRLFQAIYFATEIE